MTDSEKEELRGLIQSASGADFSRGDVISVSGLQVEGATIDKKAQEAFAEQYQKEQMFYFITSSVIPLIIVLILGCFALYILKNFISKMPSSRKLERRTQEEIIEQQTEEPEPEEDMPRIELSKKEVKTQKEQNINELNEAVMAAPEEAAKLLTSFIKD